MKIRILNPVAGGSPFCTDKRAERFIRSGRAVRVGVAIRFVESDHRHHSAQNSQASAISTAEANMRAGYDVDVETKPATLAQISGLPCTDPRGLIAVGRKFVTPKSPRMRVLFAGNHEAYAARS